MITCEWWKYLWLNEGFARYFEHFGISSLVSGFVSRLHYQRKKNLSNLDLIRLQPETNWNLDLQFVVDQFQPVLFDDSKARTHPMTNDVGSPDEILSMFNTISYDKGASVIRMIEHIIGKDNFHRAVQQYIGDK